MTEPGSLLVISLRFLGDVLLTTPLIRSLRHAYPRAVIDALVFAGTEQVLEGNPDLREVLTVAPGTPRRLWRKYDLAVIAETADRAHLYGWIAARRRVGLLPPAWGKRWWKQLSVERGVLSPADQARPLGYRKLAESMGIAWRPEVVAPTAGMEQTAWRERYAVLHLSPRFRYKRWHVAGWQALIGALHADGLRVVITGGPGADESEYVREVLAGLVVPVTDMCGRLRFAQTADLLRGAALFVGPDTATTHLAAACGTPSVALFGPTDPRLWGPQPASGPAAPYEKVIALQVRGNVSLLQEPSLPCVPCQGEGCEKHPESRSDCLDRMSAERVIGAAREAVSRAAAAARS